MSKQVIAVDIDEVLSPLQQLFMAHHNAVYGTDYPLSDPEGRYYLQDFTGDSPAEVLRKLKAFVESNDFQMVKPLEGAVEAIQELSGRHELVIITSRQDFYEEFTHRWLEEHFPQVFKSIHFTEYRIGKGLLIAKSEVARQVKARYLIDDNLEIAFEAAKAEMEVILFGEYPWNKAETLPQGITRCKDWAAVVEYFDERG